ncbi:hypothetical protein D3C81_1196930 [compost metagenome]
MIRSAAFSSTAKPEAIVIAEVLFFSIVLSYISIFEVERIIIPLPGEEFPTPQKVPKLPPFAKFLKLLS